MSAPDHDLEQLEALFHAAADLEPAARPAYLDRACAERPALRQRLEAMLSQLDRGETLDAPLPPAGALEGPGTVIDRYKLLQQIGEGGFGTVYMAEQLAPVARKVALKVIKLGMDTREVVARFEAERQALAMMDHPNIAKVLDGGATQSGRPYFVMELVRGVAITDYCDRNQLTTRQRLELFIQVCQAVQHAHQKGVIHRDLKPTNVMVTLHDGTPVPKVIDFGVAKAMHSRLTDKTLFTQYCQLIGTPAYMSPEQAEMSGLDVDTRTDIYALGVLLYELLTGTTPFATTSLVRAGLVEIQRILREEQPPRPSLRISTAADADAAGRRRLDVGALSRRVRGDLDWIVMRALEKERTRRYATANELADDVRRHLRQEPVLAGPPSAAYRLRKLLVRKRAMVASALLVVLALIGGVVGTGLGMLEAGRQRDAARREAANGRAITGFLVETLSLTDPSVALTPGLSVRTLLDRAAAQVPSAFEGQPRAEASVRATIGRAYASLGEDALAEAHLRRAVALTERLEPAVQIDDRARFYDTLWTLTHVLYRLERPDAWALANRSRAVGHDHIRARHPALAEDLDRLVATVNDGAHILDPALVTSSLPLLTAAMRRAEGTLVPGDPLWTIVADTLTAAGYALWYAPQEAYSEPFWTQALAIRRRVLPAGHPDVAEAVNQLVTVLNRAGKNAQAEAHSRAAVAALRGVYDPGAFQLAFAESLLGETLAAQGRYAEAEPLLLASHRAILANVQEPANFFAVDSLGRLVALYDGWNRPAAAAPYRRELARIGAEGPWILPWPIARHAFAPGQEALRERLDALHRIAGGVTYSAAPGHGGGEPALDPLVAEILDLRRRTVADDAPLAATVARFLLVWANGFAPDAALAARRELAAEALSLLSPRRETIPHEVAEALSQLAELAHQDGDPLGAGELGRDAFRLLRDAFAEHSWLSAIAVSRAGRRLAAIGRYQEAETLLLPGHRALAAQFGAEHRETRAVRDVLAALYRAWGRLDDAARYAPADTEDSPPPG